MRGEHMLTRGRQGIEVLQSASQDSDFWRNDSNTIDEVAWLGDDVSGLRKDIDIR